VDGVLIIDKPRGITSHDAVAAARRILREPRIGHAGTLDPLATGVLVLACGRATRLVRFLSASDKTYDATILFGVTTDTYDVTGTETSRSERRPTRDELDTAVTSLRGEHLQEPPAFSAKKVAGTRAYDLARQQKSVTLSPVPVRVSRADVLDYADGRARITLTCSAGFYVRSYAHALGQRVGSGACLEALRRTRSGDFDIEEATSLEALQRAPESAPGLIRPMEALLPWMPAVRVTEDGLARVGHGRRLERHHFVEEAPAQVVIEASTGMRWVRVLHPDGRLVAVAQATGDEGALHPSIVLN